MRLSDDTGNSSQRSWYYYDGDTRVVIGGSSVVINAVPAEGCEYRTYFLSYYDGNCWQTISRRIYLCNPYDCGDIEYSFNAAANTFDLELSAQNVSNISWIDDDNPDLDLPGDGQILPLPIEPVCRNRNISVRYFDGIGWRTCCISVEVCDPFDCQEIVPAYDEQRGGYLLSLNGSENFAEISWIDDDNPGTDLPPEDDDTFIPITGPCRQRNISARYFDSFTNRWRLCCVRYEQCPPANCEDNISFVQQADGTTLVSTLAGASQHDWEVDGNNLGGGSTVAVIIPPGEEREVCVRYLSPGTNIFSTCCRIIEIPDCELPEPLFTIAQDLDSITVNNTNSGAEVDHFWELGAILTSSLASPPTIGLPPGPHVICLTVTDDCGSQRRCIDVFVPDVQNDFIIVPQPELCAAPGDTVDIPFTALNFDLILNYQFTLAVEDESIAKIVGIEIGDIPGAWNANLDEDGGNVGILYFNSVPQTYPADEVLFVLSVEIQDGATATTNILLAQDPVPSYAEGGLNEQEIPLSIVSTAVGPCTEVQLAGMVHTATNEGIAQATVTLLRNGNPVESVLTDISGLFSFTVEPDGAIYAILPQKDVNYRNNVNVGDLSDIQQHIFSDPVLDGPYRRISADVDNSGLINVGDLSDIRQLIFGVASSFPEVSSWEFVVANHQFDDPDRPTATDYPKQIDLGSLDGDRDDLNFIGVKMGDPSNGANPAEVQQEDSPPANRSVSDLSFCVSSAPPVRGIPWEVDIYANNFQSIGALQFSLSWNRDAIDGPVVINENQELGITMDNYVRDHLLAGQLPFLWFTGGEPFTATDSIRLFTLRFNVVGEIGDSVWLNFGETPTPFYFEDASGEIEASFCSGEYIVEEFTSVTDWNNTNDLRLFPNPASGSLTLSASSLSPVEITLFDLQGRKIKDWSGVLPGASVNIEDMVQGVYLVRLLQNERVSTRRIIVQR